MKGARGFALADAAIITDGTSRQRTIVASTATATAMPTPNCLIVGSSTRMKAEKTLTMISAADVITRPVVADALDDRGRVVLRALPGLLDVRHQEHLVVHREPEEDREHQQRDVGDDRHLAGEADEADADAVLEDRGSRPRRRRRSRRGSSGPAVSGITSERKASMQQHEAERDHDQDRRARAGSRSRSRGRRSSRSCRRPTAVMSLPSVAFGMTSSRSADQELGRSPRPTARSSASR